MFSVGPLATAMDGGSVEYARAQSTGRKNCDKEKYVIVIFLPPP